jgi:WD40 repeat protein
LVSAADNDTTARVWDTVTGVETLSLVGHVGGIASVVYGRDGDTIATGSHDGTVRLWTTTNAVRPLSGHSDAVTAVDFSASNDRIVSASRDQTARIWDIATAQSTRADIQNRLSGAVVSGRSRLVSFTTWGAQSQRTVNVIDLDTGRTILTVPLDPTLSDDQIAISQDGSKLAVVTVASDVGTLGVWSISSGAQLERWSLQTTWRSRAALAFSPDGRRIAVYLAVAAAGPSEEETAQTIVFQDGLARPIALINLFLSSPPVFLPNGRGLLCGGAATIHGTRAIYLFDFRVGLPAVLFSSEDPRMAINSDGSRIVTGGDQTLRVWDPLHGELLLTIRVPAAITSVAFSPDGNRIAAGMSNGLIEVFSAYATGR